MTMHADRYFAIGSTHAVCQDYALTSQIGDRTAVYVSDGCSDSPDSDFGARFLATSASRLAGDAINGGIGALGSARCMAASCNLPERCLHATLMVARQYVFGVHVQVYGDGVLSARRRDGIVEHAVISCPAGAPDYLVYKLREGRVGEYREAIRERVESGTTDGKKHVNIYVNGEEHPNHKTVDLFEPVEFTFPAEDYDLVAIMSDGACSFQRLDGTKTVVVPVWDVVQQVMSVGNVKGEFVVRRIRNGFLNRFCRKNGWTHYDDFSVGMIHMGELPEIGDDIGGGDAPEELDDD